MESKDIVKIIYTVLIAGIILNVMNIITSLILLGVFKSIK